MKTLIKNNGKLLAIALIFTTAVIYTLIVGVPDFEPFGY